MAKYDRDGFREALTGPFTSHSVFFNRDGSIDYQGLRNSIDFVIDGGSRTIMLTYGNSLYSILTDQEVADVTKAVVKHTAGRAMVIAAERQWWTGKAVEFTRYAKEVGADMIMALPPNWGGSCTTETLVEHYTAVAEHLPLMVVTAAFSGIQGTGLNVLEILRDKLPFLAVKDDICGAFAHKIGLLLYDKCVLVSGGMKENHLNMHPYGCDGYLSTYIIFKPEIARQYWQAIKVNDFKKAVAVIAKYDNPFFSICSSFPGGSDAVIHAAIEVFGIAQRWRRKPYYSLNDQEMEKLTDFFRGLSLF